MSQEIQAPLAIPEDTFSGTFGSYIVPANKYAKLVFGGALTGVSIVIGSAITLDASGFTIGNSNSFFPDLVAGDVVDVTSQNSSASTGSMGNGQTKSIDIIPYIRVRINGVQFFTGGVGTAEATFSCSSIFGCSASTITANIETSFGISVYPIPKNNLPTELIEGN